MAEQLVDAAAIACVDLPTNVDHGHFARFIREGTAVHDVRPLFLVRPERDMTYVQTAKGERRCGPSDVIVYNQRTDEIDVIEAHVAELRYAPLDPPRAKVELTDETVDDAAGETGDSDKPLEPEPELEPPLDSVADPMPEPEPPVDGEPSATKGADEAGPQS